MVGVELDMWRLMSCLSAVWKPLF